MKLSTEDHIELLMMPSRYGNAVDDRDWPMLQRLFTQDATFEVRSMNLQLRGRAAIIAFMDDTKAHPLGHLMANVVVDEAEAGAQVRFRALFPIAEADGATGTYRVAFACYYDEVVQTEGVWQISRRLVTRAPRDMQPSAGDRRHDAGLAQLFAADQGR